MTKKKGHLGSPWVFLFAWIFAFVAAGCGGAEYARAKTAGLPGAYADEEAAAEAAAPEAPAPAPMAAPPSESPLPPDVGPSLSDAVAQGGPPRTQRDAPHKEAADVPGPSPGVPAIAEPVAEAGRAPLLIYMATMTLAVFGTKDAIGAVEELARSVGGYLVSRSDQTVTVRVPAKAFQGALSGVSKLGDELHREVNVRDVTEQFADLEIRLKNAEAVRQRLEALLAKAGKIEDALAVERELERVTQMIEQMKGRMRLLGELIAFSTITVNFQARPRDQVGSEVRLPFGWLTGLGLPPLMNLEAP